MALTGLEIYKHLPKTNCKDCGLPTCLAFAMKMATKQVSLDKCPHVTAAGKAALESASRPPIQLVTIGSGDAEIKIGNETQLYRHEEKFHRPTAVAVRISDALDDAAVGRTGRGHRQARASSGSASRSRSIWWPWTTCPATPSAFEKAAGWRRRSPAWPAC